MYGKWVTLEFGEQFQVRVFVFCTPATSDDELRVRALMLLSAKVEEWRYEPA